MTSYWVVFEWQTNISPKFDFKQNKFENFKMSILKD